MTSTKYPICRTIKLRSVQASAVQIEPVVKKVESATMDDAVVIPTRNCGKFIIFLAASDLMTAETTSLTHLPHTNGFTLLMVAQVPNGLEVYACLIRPLVEALPAAAGHSMRGCAVLKGCRAWRIVVVAEVAAYGAWSTAPSGEPYSDRRKIHRETPLPGSSPGDVAPRRGSAKKGETMAE
ncbi:hypothetical protein [Mesorhizobium sp. M9A.F.Ca.ET.002.03.1.2]|uniref:hypothetical protein n=1 Tax=Mesorhizobium sp. M9A.F.Ca.ET.002.03.1.2 TaxID=2493668 RepID=UPI001FE0D973|nr:hypothetical protein [Mesorhizobium sp. M9A.F.Ca.ET.002.03.1.2]